MATNFEFYKDELSNVLAQREGRCIVMEADDIMKRGFHRFCKGSDCGECWRELFKYLAEEHIEQPKLTKRERAFCEAVQTGWLVRAGEYLYWHKVKPVEEESGSFLFPHTGDSFPMTIKTEGLAFDLIKNKEMLSVEDLLKLEVIEVQHETD